MSKLTLTVGITLKAEREPREISLGPIPAPHNGPCRSEPGCDGNCVDLGRVLSSWKMGCNVLQISPCSHAKRAIKLEAEIAKLKNSAL